MITVTSNWRGACITNLSDFLGRIFLLVQMSWIFACDLRLHRDIAPYFCSLDSLSFSTNNVCKNVVFFLAVSFPNKAFVFPNSKIGEAQICHQGWFRKTWIFACVISRTAEKFVFPLSPRSHAKIQLIWMPKKNSFFFCIQTKEKRPKKSLTSSRIPGHIRDLIMALN